MPVGHGSGCPLAGGEARAVNRNSHGGYHLRVVHYLRLTHPALDFWIDVGLREFRGRWLAVADLADTPEVGTGETPAEALRGALAAFGPALAERLVAGATLRGALR